METPTADDIIMWMMLISIVAICITVFYLGVTGFMNMPMLNETPGRMAFAATGYALFLLIPLMIIDLMLESAVISRYIEWSTTLLVIAVIIDILLLTALRLVFY